MGVVTITLLLPGIVLNVLHTVISFDLQSHKAGAIISILQMQTPRAWRIEILCLRYAESGFGNHLAPKPVVLTWSKR